MKKKAQISHGPKNSITAIRLFLHGALQFCCFDFLKIFADFDLHTHKNYNDLKLGLPCKEIEVSKKSLIAIVMKNDFEQSY